MQVLTARQCPQCVLRFGSISELNQHLRLDHRPAAPQPEQRHDDTEQAAGNDGHRLGEPTPSGGRSIASAIAVAVLIASIAVLSWRVAALVSLGLAAALTVRAGSRTVTSKGRCP